MNSDIHNLIKNYWVKKHGRLLTVEERAHNKYLANKRWKAKNKEKVKALAHKHYRLLVERQPDYFKKRNKESYFKHRAKRLAYSKKYIQTHRHISRKSSLKYWRKMQAFKKAPKCQSCDSIINKNMLYCEWCIKTYHYEVTRQKSHSKIS